MRLAVIVGTKFGHKCVGAIYSGLQILTRYCKYVVPPFFIAGNIIILIPIQKVRKEGMSILLRSPRSDKIIPIPTIIAFRFFELEWVYQSVSSHLHEESASEYLGSEAIVTAQSWEPKQWQKNAPIF
jgi:hypothetical protein